MTKLTIALTSDEQKALYRIADQDLRLPDQVFRWLIRTEATKRGLWTTLDRSEEACATNTLLPTGTTPAHI